MPQISSFSVMFYGGYDGYQSHRAQIQVVDTTGKPAAWIRFADPGRLTESDYVENNIIRMHLPSDMLENVLDVLRTDKQVNIYFVSGHAFLTSGSENAGFEDKP